LAESSKNVLRSFAFSKYRQKVTLVLLVPNQTNQYPGLVL
jgi:hypothetical protein